MKNLAGQTFERATIFQPGFLMGYRQSEVKDLRFVSAKDQWGEIIPAAQFVFRGKRKEQLLRTSGLVVIDGWDHPELEVWEEDSNTSGLTVKEAKYTAASDKWDVLLDEYLGELEPTVIYDDRSEGEGSLYASSVEENETYSDTTYPDEVEEVSTLREGAVKQVSVNRYERSKEARQKCLNHHGCVCKVCGLDMEDMYNEIGRGFIHVHHRVPLSEIGEDYEVDPVKDLVPVCPNCHSMIHRPKEMLRVKELRDVVESNRGSAT